MAEPCSQHPQARATTIVTQRIGPVRIVSILRVVREKKEVKGEIQHFSNVDMSMSDKLCVPQAHLLEK